MFAIVLASCIVQSSQAVVGASIMIPVVLAAGPIIYKAAIVTAGAVICSNPTVHKVLATCLLKLKDGGETALPWVRDFLSKQAPAIAESVMATLRSFGYPV